MARIPESFLNDLLNRVDIVDVVERYLPLKKAGQNYSACCPFHKEKSPSFTVSPTKQFYHCFGCGVHGSALNFVMEYEGLSFPEAVKKLAESVGLAVPVEAQVAEVSRATPGVFDVLKAACDYYRANLKRAPQAIDYLKQRGLEGRTAARFGLGFAPGGEDWQPLKAAFPDYDWNKLLAEAGLVIDKEENGRRYDRFRDRVMFPILNQRGAVIGFGGRVMGKGEPKYLNSPETSVFEKGRELYGLTQARAAIRDGGRVLVVEGYMDVVMLAQHGVEYAVATLGTACTPDHARKLVKLADEVVFCFDGDKAGRKAAWRALENSLAVVRDGKALRFLFLPDDHDPDSFVRAFGREAFETQVRDEALGLAAYLLRELSMQVKLSTEEGRAKLWQLAQPYLEQMAEAPALKMMTMKRLGELCQLSLDEMQVLQGSQAVAASHVAPAQQVVNDYPVVDSYAPRFTAPQVRTEGGFRSRSQGRWQGDKRRAAAPALPRITPIQPLERLMRLVLCNPAAVMQLPRVEAGWPREGRIAVVVELLELARATPQATGEQLLEFWRHRPEFPHLGEALRAAQDLLVSTDAEEAERELADTLESVERQVIIPQRRARLAQLDAQQQAGGLTEAEKSEYAALVRLIR
ncbi:DNA primase [Chitinibacteraceae bacterium HSL-7]